MSHFIKKCKVCQTVISQCRCPGPKTEIWEICANCKIAQSEDCQSPQDKEKKDDN